MIPHDETAAATDRDAALTFLRILYARCNLGALVLVTAPTFAPLRFALGCLENAVAAACARALGADVYVTIATMGPLTSGRGTTDDVLELPALFVDVDVAGPGHAAGADMLAPSLDAATALLERIGVKPSIIVGSGGGVHGYWLLDAPLTGDAIAPALAAWRAAWQTIATGCPWSKAIDAGLAGNAACVLRVPGTINRKDAANLRPVRLLELDGDRRYAVGDLLAAARAVVAAAPPAPPRTAIPAPATGPRAVVTDGDRLGAHVAAAIEGECAAVATTSPGSRNEALNREAFNLGTLLAASWTHAHIDRPLIVDRLMHAAGECRYLDDTAHGSTPDARQRHAEGVIASGIEAGAEHPRPEPADRPLAERATGGGTGCAPADEGYGQTVVRESQATLLVRLAGEAGAELFKTPGGVAFATVPVDEHRETCAVDSRAFRHWLAARFWATAGKVPNAQALSDACGVLSGSAIYGGNVDDVHTRLAGHGDAIYLDLGCPRWRAVKVDAVGWRVINRPPVRFRRPTRGFCELPTPVSGGGLLELRELLNLADDDAWSLVVTWLVAAARPVGPYPVLVLGGEQGSGKSSAARFLRRVLDPSEADIRAEPREVRDLMIAATAGWIVALDNVSRVEPWLSDALCRLSTGGGFAIRTLYQNDEETIFSAQRPTILNGISELATRGDLLDRSLLVTLPRIPDDRRATEAALRQRYTDAWPRLLGAVLDAVSVGMRRLPEVRLARLPRMADFALFANAAEPALGLDAGAFNRAYGVNREGAHELALEGSPLVPYLRDHVAASGGRWTGTAMSLLESLDKLRGDGRAPHGWPQTAHAMSGALRRLAPNLRATGLDVVTGTRTGHDRRRIVMLEEVGGTSSATSASPATGREGRQIGLLGDGDADDVGAARTIDRPHGGTSSAREGRQNGKADDADDADDVPPTLHAACAPAPTWRCACGKTSAGAACWNCKTPRADVAQEIEEVTV